METVFFFVMGTFFFLAGLCNWDWFMNSRKVRRLVALFGRPATRVLYSCVGGLFIILGAVFAMRMH